jgi:hypothetical protein
METTTTPKYEFNKTILNTPDVLMEFGIRRRQLENTGSE